MATKYIPGEVGGEMRSWFKGTGLREAAMPFTRTWARDCEEEGEVQYSEESRFRKGRGMGTLKGREVDTFNLRLKVF